MSARRGSGYLTHLLQRSRDIFKGAVAPRRRALFEENPGAAAVSESPRPVHLPGEPDPASPWQALNSETDSGRLTQAGVRDRQAPPAATDTALRRQTPVPEPVVRKVTQDTVTARQPQHRARDHHPPRPSNVGVTPVNARPADADLDSVIQPVGLRPVDIARQSPQATATPYLVDSVASEVSPRSMPVSVPVQVQRKDAAEGSVPAQRRPAQHGEQPIESRPQPEPREPPPELKPVSRAATEPPSAIADPVGQRQGDKRGWLETPPALPPGPALSRNSSQAPPTVQITIGRIEVRAVTPQRQTPAPVRRVSRPRQPAMSLDDYLKKRNGGGR